MKTKELTPETSFLKDWTPFEKLEKQMERAILNHFIKHTYKWLKEHGKPLINFNPTTFEQIDNVLGLAYTSTGAYAGLFCCNGGYIMYNSTHHFTSFVITKGGKFAAIVEDENENEIIIEL